MMEFKCNRRENFFVRARKTPRLALASVRAVNVSSETFGDVVGAFLRVLNNFTPPGKVLSAWKKFCPKG